MATRLPLRSLEIEGYRAIRHLRIERLGQVNLFVGKNNVGKTSLLEAIRLYVSRNPRVVMSELIAEKGDYRPRLVSSRDRNREITQEDFESVAEEVEGFFYGSYTGSGRGSIIIGPAGLESDLLTLSLPWLQSVQPDGTTARLSSDVFVGPDSPVILIERGGEQVAIPFDLLFRRVPLARPVHRAEVVLVPAGGLSASRTAVLWDRAAAAGRGPDVEHALRSIVPDLDRVYLLGDSHAASRSIALALRGAARPVPLRSMGDGVNRVFGIALALVLAQEGVVLIDEVENGLHYSVQEEVWRAVFLLANELDVQVFATTHSWDGIRAFAAASNESAALEGTLHRLENRGQDTLRDIELTEKDLAIVARQRIEVR